MTRDELISIISDTVLCKGRDTYSVIGERHTRAVLAAIEAAGLCIVPREMPFMPESRGWEGDQGRIYSDFWHTMIEAGRI